MSWLIRAEWRMRKLINHAIGGSDIGSDIQRQAFIWANDNSVIVDWTLKQTLMIFESKYDHFLSRKLIWKQLPQNCG